MRVSSRMDEDEPDAALADLAVRCAKQFAKEYPFAAGEHVGRMRGVVYGYRTMGVSCHIHWTPSGNLSVWAWRVDEKEGA